MRPCKTLFFLSHQTSNYSLRIKLVYHFFLVKILFLKNYIALRFSIKSSDKNIKLISESSLFDAEWYKEQYFNKSSCNVQIASHYYYIGWMLGFDPSTKFSTNFYLKKYDDVRKARINPLLHYLINGEAEGRRKLPINLLSQTKNIDILFFFGMPLENDLFKGAIELVRELESQSLRVFTYSNNDRVLSNVKHSERIEFVFDEIINSKKSESVLFDDFIDEVAALNLLKNSGILADLTQSRKATLTAFRDWHSALKNNQPKYLIIWGSTSPLSRLLVYLSRLLDITYVILERGHFTKTFSVETGEQWGRGRSLLSPQSNWAFNSLSLNKTDIDQICRLRNFDYQENEKSKWREEKSGDYWLVLGCNDFGAGITTGSNATRNKHSLFVDSTKELLLLVLEAKQKLGKLETKVVFRPHPSDPNDYEGLDGFTLDTESSVEQLVSQCTLCFTISTTASVNCLLYGKPLIQVGLSDMTNKGLVYQCFAPDDLVHYADIITKEGHCEEVIERGYKYLIYLIKTDLIGFNNSFVTKNVSDFGLCIKQIVKGK